MSESSALEALATSLTPMEMGLVGNSLKAGQPVSMAISGVSSNRSALARVQIDELLQEMDKKLVGAALLAMASAARRATSEIEVVWSGPMPSEAMGRTTWAVLGEVVQDAREFIYAATYSAGINAPALKALRGAINRGVTVTCVVDFAHMQHTVEILKSELNGARFLALVAQDGDDIPLMHAKFIVVDGHSTFLTSANFSNIAVDKSLEVGLLVRNSFVAHQFKKRIEDLVGEGKLKRI